MKTRKSNLFNYDLNRSVTETYHLSVLVEETHIWSKMNNGQSDHGPMWEPQELWFHSISCQYNI